MISKCCKVPGAAYTANATVYEWDCHNDLGGAVISAKIYIPAVTIATATAVDMTIHDVFGTTEFDVSSVDISLSNGSAADYTITVDNASIDDPDTEANGAVDNVPLIFQKFRVNIHATWGGGTVTLPDWYICFIIAPYEK